MNHICSYWQQTIYSVHFAFCNAPAFLRWMHIAEKRRSTTTTTKSTRWCEIIESEGFNFMELLRRINTFNLFIRTYSLCCWCVRCNWADGTQYEMSEVWQLLSWSISFVFFCLVVVECSPTSFIQSQLYLYMVNCLIIFLRRLDKK